MVAHTGEHGGDKVRHRSRAVLQDEDEDEEVKAQVDKSSLETFNGRELPLVGNDLGSIMLNAGNCKSPFLITETFARRVGIVGENACGEHSKSDGDEALNQEQPPPAPPSVDTFEARDNGARDETGRSTREADSCVEQTPPLSCI